MKVLTGGTSAELRDPAAAAWDKAERTTIALGPAPLESQPTAYIRNAWADRSYGTTSEADVALATDGDEFFVRLEWADDPTANTEFSDAAGAIFPDADGAPVATMGDEDLAARIWYWEDGRPAPLNLISNGPGVVEKQDNGALKATATSDGSRWSAVISGPKDAAQAAKIGFVVWNGSNEERAGLGAVSSEWATVEFS
jgi:DMSO reductase family type II enzyme heme b subunit